MRPALGAAAGVVVGLVVTGWLATAVEPWGSGPAEVDTGAVTVPSAEAAAAFVDAWERSLTGTYRSVARYERRRDGEVLVVAEVRTAQRPPLRLVVSGDTVTARDAELETACAVDIDGRFRCRSAAATTTDAQEVADEVALLATYVEGPDVLYRVQRSEGSGCFDLELVREIDSPPYGRSARFCFDDDTGAVLSSEVHRDTVDDVTVVSELSATVSDADLVPPSDGSAASSE